METVWIVIFGIVALTVVGLVGMMIIWQDARGRLPQRFGPEYDRQVGVRGGKRKAKRRLSDVAHRRPQPTKQTRRRPRTRMRSIWKRLRGRLQRRSGPEYDRQVRLRGSKRKAKRHLSDVEHRRDQLDIRPLEPAARERYTQRWEAVQAAFVDRPGPALDEADRLVMDVMHDRGYPVSDFTERAELLAVDHPEVVEHYRAAHAARQSHQGHPSTSDTEHLRQAFVHYRMLFEELVRDGKPGDRIA